MSVTFREDSYLNYGNCLYIENDHAQLIVTLELGPRIISYSLPGKENMLKVDPQRKNFNDGPAFDSYYYKGAAWYIYGGHRLWIAPESLPETYYPDNSPISYDIQGSTVLLTPPSQPENGFQSQISVTLAEDSAKVTISHQLTNISREEKHAAAWAITVMSPGGFEILPQPNRDTGLLANRQLALWAYTNMADPRVRWGKDYITLRQDPNGDGPFKLGINGERQWAAYLNHGCCFVKTFTHTMGEDYPDGGMSYETYTNPEILEMESLSPMRRLAAGETILHTEEWNLLEAPNPPAPDDMAAVAALANSLKL